MAGHSKWANIRHRKGRQDAIRGKLFTKLIREITVAAKMGGGDPAANARLRAAIDAALSKNMPKDTVDRAIKRGAGGGEDTNVEEVRYEGYGPGGVAVIVDCMTDNRNRTVSEVRHAFSKAGGNLGQDGSVAYLFSKTGVLTFPASAGEDEIMEAAIEAGAEDIVTDADGTIEVLCSAEDFGAVKDGLVAAGLTPENDEVTMRPSTNSSLELDDAEKLLRLLDVLEELDDVQQVYSNVEITAEVMAQL
jgi:YebC/PmpR family DNA-binding regulatory protein